MVNHYNVSDYKEEVLYVLCPIISFNFHMISVNYQLYVPSTLPFQSSSAVGTYTLTLAIIYCLYILSKHLFLHDSLLRYGVGNRYIFVIGSWCLYFIHTITCKDARFM